jgi:hypothetical protein
MKVALSHNIFGTEINEQCRKQNNTSTLKKALRTIRYLIMSSQSELRVQDAVFYLLAGYPTASDIFCFPKMKLT